MFNQLRKVRNGDKNSTKRPSETSARSTGSPQFLKLCVIVVVILANNLFWGSMMMNEHSVFTATLRRFRLVRTSIVPSGRPIVAPEFDENFSKLSSYEKKRCHLEKYFQGDVLPIAQDKALSYQLSEEQKRRPKYMIECNIDSWGTYVMREFYFLLKSLRDDYGWQQIRGDEAVKPGLLYPASPGNRSFIPPLAIFFCESAIELYPQLALDKVRQQGTTILAWGDDLHMYHRFSVYQLMKVLNETDVIINTYSYIMDHYFGPVTEFMMAKAEVKHQRAKLPQRLWIPHSAGPDFVGFELNKQALPKIFLSGATYPDVYPLRHFFGTEFNKSNPEYIHIYKHPGYQRHALNHSRVYASEIHKYMFSVTCTSTYRFLVAKVFEIPATGSLLLVNLDLEPILASLGLRDMVHYVGYHDEDPLPRLRWVFSTMNQEKVALIREQGQAEVLRRHQTHHRAQAINDYVMKGIVHYKIPVMDIHRCPCPTIGMSGKECSKAFHDHRKVNPAWNKSEALLHASDDVVAKLMKRRRKRKKKAEH